MISWNEHTAAVDFPSPQKHCDTEGVWEPFLLDNVRADKEQRGWDIDSVDVRRRQYGGRHSECDEETNGSSIGQDDVAMGADGSSKS